MADGNLRKKKYMVIAGLVITSFLFGNIALAGKMKISAQQAEEIKTVLGITQTILNISKLIINDNDLATILNKAISVGQTGTDATYGLLVLSALNEMDMMDLVLSQRYKTEARDYFDKVLEEKTNLLAYWKGVGFDIPRVASGYITGPIAGLTLNSFAITDKTIAIFGEFEVLKKMKLYDGLWYYFDLRKQGNEPHAIAWDETKMVIGFGSNSIGFHRASNRENELAQLEVQFSALWDKWGTYATPYGISEKYKEQLASELRNTLVTALEVQSFAEKAPEPSLIDKLFSQFIKLKEIAAVLINQINPFKAGPIVDLSRPEPVEELTEAEPLLIEPLSIEAESKTEPSIKTAEAEIKEAEPLLIEPISITTTTIPELPASTTEPVPIPEPPPTPTIAPAPILGPMFCERESGNPTRFRVLINEVAWMGTVNSSNDEWIELKNIWGIPVDLNGWQILDKDRQIKIIFGEEDIVPANGYYLLERTDDNSMPDAKADLIYTGALGNTDEALYLFNDQCNIEDEVLANPNWPTGDNSLKKPMARFDVLDWYTGASTPGGENSSPPITRSSAGAPAPPPTSSPASPQIFITEVRISPLTERFVELYNPNNETIDLTGWYIQRKIGEGPLSSFVSSPNFEGKTISPLGYFLVAHSSSTIATSADILLNLTLTLNNTLLLKNPEREIVDQIYTGNPAVGKSYGRKWSSTTLNYMEDFEAQNPTPRAQNQNSEIGEGGGEEESLSVVINEIAWMGTGANPADEWIELYNNTSSTVDLTGWTLSAAGGTPLITFSTSTILAQNYFLLERTDNNAISDIPADLIYTGALGNTGEKLELKDADGNVIDLVDASTGWFAGEASPSHISMERINPLAGNDPANWMSNNLITKNGLGADGNPVNGTPKAENSVAKNYTILSGGIAFDEDFTLRRLGSPYISNGPIHVLPGVTLSIEPGVIIKFQHGSSRTPYAELKIEGSLESLGGSEPNQKIVFTSYKDDEYGGDTNNDGDATQPAAGDWDWIYLKDSVSSFQNVIVRYGGKLHSSCCGEFPSYTYGAIYVDGGQLTISSSTVEKSETLGVWINNSSTTQISGTEFKDINTAWSKPAAVYIENGSSTISNSTFYANNIGVLVENFASSAIENNVFEENQIPIQINTLLPTISGNTFNNNNYNGIYLISLAFPEEQASMIWKEAGIPYIIGTLNLAAGLTLQVEPGVVIKFLSNSRLNIEGNLEANGSTDNKIVFTSIQDDEYSGDTNNDDADTQPAAGSWHYVYFAASSANSIFDNVIIRYGGWYNVFEGGTDAKSGAVKTGGASLTIRNSLFENNLFAGLQIANATTTIENTAFNKNEQGVYIENDVGECPDLSGAIFGQGENANSVDVFPLDCAP